MDYLKEGLLQQIQEKEQQIKSIEEKKKELEDKFCEKYASFQPGDFAELYFDNDVNITFQEYVKIMSVKKYGNGFKYRAIPMKKNLNEEKMRRDPVNVIMRDGDDRSIYELRPIEK